MLALAGDSDFRELADVDDLVGEVDLVHLRLGNAEQILDHVEQHGAARIDVVRVFLVAVGAHRSETLILHHLRETDDVGKRRAEIMIHVGEEALAALVRLLAARFGVVHGLFELAPHRDVVEGRDAGRNAAPARVHDAHFGKAAVAVGPCDGDVVFAGVEGRPKACPTSSSALRPSKSCAAPLAKRTMP